MSNSSAADTAYNALQIVGSVVSILTFIYALAVSAWLYVKTAASSPQEVNEFIINLQFSYEEIQTFAHSYANYEKDREGSPNPEAQALAAKAYLIEGHTRNRLEGLRKLAQKIGTMANASFFRRWSNRVRFVLLEDELAKNVAGKDRLMDELRRVQERFDKFADERRARHRDAMQEQQIGLLQSVLYRLDALEGDSPKHMVSSVESSNASFASSQTAA